MLLAVSGITNDSGCSTPAARPPQQEPQLQSAAETTMIGRAIGFNARPSKEPGAHNQCDGQGPKARAEADDSERSDQDGPSGITKLSTNLGSTHRPAHPIG
jgi:hypothetical protein